MSKLTTKVKLGYAIGTLGENAATNIVSMYFLYFLTDAAGIVPAKAGAVVSIAIIWCAVLAPLVGYISDNYRRIGGSRVAFMKRTVIPYCLCMFLIFNNINVSENIKMIYFVLAAVGFYTCYAFYALPYYALGGEITDDFSERTSIRAWTSGTGYVLFIFMMACPPVIETMLTEYMGITLSQGWRIVGLMFSVIMFMGMCICILCTGKKERDVHLHVKVDWKVKWKDMFGSYWEVLKLKPMRYLVSSVFLWSFGAAVVSSAAIYMLVDVFPERPEMRSMYFVCAGSFAAVWTTVVNMVGKRFDKKRVFITGITICGIGLNLFYFIGISSFANIAVLVAFYTLGSGTFYVMYVSMMYDISELDEFVNGKSRIGAMTGLLDLTQKCGSAISMQIMGLVLQLGGYGVPGHEAQASETILFINTILPGVLIIGAVAVAIFYPVTHARHDALKAALKNKKEGKPYSEEGFSKLL